MIRDTKALICCLWFIALASLLAQDAGAQAPAELVKDFTVAGPNGAANPSSFVQVGSAYFFVATTPEYGTELPSH